VRSFGWYRNSESIFITMEYIAHGDLRRYLRVLMPEAEVRIITRQLLDGLQHMHKNRFAHRDLKPEVGPGSEATCATVDTLKSQLAQADCFPPQNILVVSKGPDWLVQISDFGISKRLQEGGTMHGTMRQGTLGFMAPELLGFIPEKRFPYASDMWSLGAVAYRMFTGKLFLAGLDDMREFVIGDKGFPDRDLVASGLSDAGLDFVRKLLIAQPKQRPSSLEAEHHDWFGDLQEANIYPTISTIPDSPDEHTMRESQLPATDGMLTFEREGNANTEESKASAPWSWKSTNPDDPFGIEDIIPSDQEDNIESATLRLAKVEVQEAPSVPDAPPNQQDKPKNGSLIVPNPPNSEETELPLSGRSLPSVPPSLQMVTHSSKKQLPKSGDEKRGVEKEKQAAIREKSSLRPSDDEEDYYMESGYDSEGSYTSEMSIDNQPSNEHQDPNQSSSCAVCHCSISADLVGKASMPCHAECGDQICLLCIESMLETYVLDFTRPLPNCPRGELLEYHPSDLKDRISGVAQDGDPLHNLVKAYKILDYKMGTESGACCHTCNAEAAPGRDMDYEDTPVHRTASGREWRACKQCGTRFCTWCLQRLGILDEETNEPVHPVPIGITCQYRDLVDATRYHVRTRKHASALEFAAEYMSVAVQTHRNLDDHVEDNMSLTARRDRLRTDWRRRLAV